MRPAPVAGVLAQEERAGARDHVRLAAHGRHPTRGTVLNDRAVAGVRVGDRVHEVVDLDHAGDAPGLEHAHGLEHHHVGRPLEDDHVGPVRIHRAEDGPVSGALAVHVETRVDLELDVRAGRLDGVGGLLHAVKATPALVGGEK
jgi:hypothetical protein